MLEWLAAGYGVVRILLCRSPDGQLELTVVIFQSSLEHSKKFPGETF